MRFLRAGFVSYDIVGVQHFCAIQSRGLALRVFLFTFFTLTRFFTLGILRRLCLVFSLPVFFLVCADVSSAGALHRLRFDHFSIDQGLPSTGIMTVYQTHDGYIWIGTANGLARYDGRHIRSFTNSPDDLQTLSHPRVFSLFEDQEKYLWVGTRRGIDRLTLATDVVERMLLPPEIEPKSRTVYGIVRAGAHTLWLASAGGLLKLDSSTGKITRSVDALTGRSFGVGEVRAIISDGAEGIWFAQGSQVFHLDRHETVVQMVDVHKHAGAAHLNALEQMVRSLALTPQGRLWVGLNGGLVSWQKNGEAGLMAAFQLASQLQVPRAVVTSILQDHEQAVWLAFGDDQGLYRWREKALSLEHFIHLPSVESSLSGDSLTSLMLDSSGGLWIGSTDYGANLVDLKGRGFSTYLHIPGDERSLSHQLVTAVLPDDLDDVWVGTLGGGLNRVHLKNGDTQRIPLAEVGVDFIRMIARDERQRLWIGGEALHVYDPKTHLSIPIVSKQSLPPGTRFTAVALDANGEAWAASSAGLYRIKKEGEVKIYHSNLSTLDALNEDAIDSLLIDREKRLWVGTKGALYLYDRERDRFQLIGRPGKNLPAVDRLGVTALKQDRFGRIWAATVLGLLEVKSKVIRFSASKQQELEWELASWKDVGGLPNDIIESMQDAENGDVWMSSERGLMRMRPGDQSGRNYPSIGRFEGAFNFAAAARGLDGNLFFGGVGLVSFHPDAVWDNKVAPRVILSDILLFNRSLAAERRSGSSSESAMLDSGALNQNIETQVKQSSLSDVGINGPLSMAKKMQLDHSQSMISFEMSALHFYDYTQNRYAWKLEGYDEHWIIGQDDRAMATYTNLDPRTYTLLAKAANPDGVWGESTVLMQVTVLPPYWRTWWWYLGWLVVMVASGVWLYRNRLQRIRQHEQYLAERVKQQTQEILSQKNRADMQRVLAERARNDIGRLSEVGLQITASLDVKCILDTLYAHVFGLIDATTIGVGFVDWDNRQINFDYCMQGDQRILPYARSLDAPEQPASQCVLQGKELIIDDIAHDSSRLDVIMAQKMGMNVTALENGGRTEDSRSGIYVPIMHGGRVMGVLGVLSLRRNAFGQNELNILRTLATYVAVAYDNAEAYRRLELTQSKLVEQEKMAALGSLVAGVAHELNTPIGNSLLMASTIRDVSLEFLARVKNSQLRRSDLESFCQTANNSSELLVKSLSSAASLVSSFKQIAVDQTSDQRRFFNLSIFCEEVAMTLAARMKRDGHELRLDIPDNIALDSYPGAMGQVLSNLIINAIVHGFDGRKQGVIELQCRPVGEHLLSLSLRDNGHGISADHLPRIFEPFFTTRLGEGGSGLGLHICYNIVVSILGGTIEVESERGSGTMFVMTIPKCAPLKEGDEL